MTSAISTDRTATGSGILARTWQPSGAPAGRILIVHGIAEHSGRYERSARLLAEAGFDVRAFDLPGFGVSRGRRAYVERWDDYLAAVAEQLATLRGDDGVRPVVLLGHSMGALIALTYVLHAEERGRPMPDLLVLSGPPLGRPPLPLALRLAAPVLARVVPRLELSNGLHRDMLSRDPRVGESYAGDPLVHTRTTARLGHELFSAMARASAELDERRTLPLPALVLHGADDRIASPEQCRPLRRLADCDYRLLDGLRHEIFNEPEGPDVVGQVIEWIRSQASPGQASVTASAASTSTAAGP